MSHLQPVRSNYEPAYPQELTAEQVQELLHPGLLKRFSQQTIATGALIAGMAATGCSPSSGGPSVEIGGKTPTDDEADAANSGTDHVAIGKAGVPRSRRERKGTTTSNDPNLKKKVDTIVAEVLGRAGRGSWYDRSFLRPVKELKTNPPVKYPVIPISYGNSCVGIFDHTTAREATHRLFETFGIKLQKNVNVKGNGYTFTADGFSEDARIGFELTLPQGRNGFFRKPFEKESDAAFLSDEEIVDLEKDAESGRVNMLVIDATQFPNMDGDLYTPMEYYLASVVDYLNWVHGDSQIDPMMVLGKLPGRMATLKKQVDAWQEKYATIPGGGFEDADDLKSWSAIDVKLSQSQRFSGNLAASRKESSSVGSKSLQLEFETGGSARYTVPEGATVRLPDGKVEFVCRAFHSYGKVAPLKIILTGKDGSTWQISQSISSITDVRAARDEAPFEELASIEFSMGGDATYIVWMDDLAFTRSKD